MSSQALLAERLQDLTSVYERNAYLVYNVARRTAVDLDAAHRAGRRAFLAQAQALDEGRLAADAARFGIAEAPSLKGLTLDDPAEQAAARLAPPERAALALAALADAQPADIGAALGVSEEAAADVLRRAWANLGEAARAYRDQAWIEPPPELWAELYPELHAGVAQALRAGIEDTHPAAAEAQARPGRGAVAVLRRVPARAVVIALVLASTAAGAVALQGGDSDGESAPDGTTPSGGLLVDAESTEDGAVAPGAGPSSPGGKYEELSPEELDRLRQKEIADLKRFSQRENDKRLPRAERREASNRVDELIELAERRQRAAERRELALRQQLAREREARVRERERNRARDREPPAGDDEPTSASDREDTSSSTPSRPREDGSPERDRDRDGRDQQEAECLYDEQNGTYICPE